MKITSTRPFLLRRYSVSELAEDTGAHGPQSSSAVRPLGRAILRSARQGAPVVVAATETVTQAGPSELDYMRLAKGVAAVAGETLTGKAVAQSAWRLSAMSSTTTPEELARTLVSHHVGPEHAKLVAENALKVLGDPITRGILISISAGAATYIVVQRTSLTRTRKWIIILGVAALTGLGFAALYHLQLAA